MEGGRGREDQMEGGKWREDQRERDRNGRSERTSWREWSKLDIGL